MGFGQGLSGLNAASQNLDVIGNNIANSGTVGFKSGTATFADVYANSRVGLGVQVSGVNQRFTVGNVSTTGNMLDMAIDGEKGLFRLVDSSGAVLYSRNGQFFANQDNYIVNAQGQRLTGYPAGGVGLNPVPLMVPVGNIAPQASSAGTVKVNLDANEAVISETGSAEVLGEVTLEDGGGVATTYNFRMDDEGNITWTDGTGATVAAPADGVYTDPTDPAVTVTIGAGQVTVGSLSNFDDYAAYQPTVIATPFDPSNPDSFTHSFPMNVYDSLGNEHQLTQYFVKRAGTTGTTSQWDVYYRLDGAPLDAPAGGGPVSMEYDMNGRLTTAPIVNLTFNSPGGVNSPAEAMNIALNYTGSSSYGGTFTNDFGMDGYPTGEYASMSVGADGTLLANYTNGETQVVGTVVLANFRNVQGLQPVGGNAFVQTAASGQPILGQPGSNSLASLKGQAVEESNVNMSQELVNMIIAQRTYQANAETIQTQDQILQTLISMR